MKSKKLISILMTLLILVSSVFINGNIVNAEKETLSATEVQNNILANSATNSKISAGFSHSLHLRDDGTVWSWGSNSSGELGDGTFTAKTHPVRVYGLTNIIAVSAGYSHSLAVRSDGTVWGWGLNNNGQIKGSNSNHNRPVKIEGLPAIKAVEAGTYFSLALTEGGEVYSWGLNNDGQLGLGNRDTIQAPQRIESLNNVKSISAGGGHSMAIESSGNTTIVKAWGKNDSGQVGIFSTSYGVRTPTQVQGLTGVSQVSAGDSFSLALTESGQIYSWGSNFYGQLGNGNTSGNSTPTAIANSFGGTVTKVAAGRSHSLALTDTGDVWAWGDNASGELGNGEIRVSGGAYQTTPRKASIFGAKHISAGGYFSLASKLNDKAWAWGKNTNNMLAVGIGSADKIVKPSILFEPMFAAGKNNFEVELRYDGTVWINSNKVDIENVKYITLTDDSYFYDPLPIVAFAVKTDGTVWSLGNSENIFVEQIQLDANFIEVSISNNYATALTDDGTCYRWAIENFNYFNKIVSDLSNVISVEEGSDYDTSVPIGGGSHIPSQSHGSVLNADGDVFSLRASGRTFIAEKIQGLSNVKAIAANNTILYALKTDGTVWQRAYPSPVLIEGLSNVYSISAISRNLRTLSYSDTIGVNPTYGNEELDFFPTRVISGVNKGYIINGYGMVYTADDNTHVCNLWALPANMIDIHDYSTLSGTGWEINGLNCEIRGDVIITGTENHGGYSMHIIGGTYEDPIEVILDNLSTSSSIILEPDTHAKLILDNKNTITAAYGDTVGIQTTGSALTIEAGIGEASLTVSAENGAGIGGDVGEYGDSGRNGGDGGRITIKGGKITAISNSGAGIGGGRGGNASGGNGGDGGSGASLNILGGIVIARSTSGAAIGGGAGGSGRGSSGSQGDAGSCDVRLEHTYQTLENGTVYTSPPNPFTPNNNYRYVKIDCTKTVVTPSNPTVSLNKSLYLSDDTITVNWDTCENAYWYDVFIKSETGAPEMVATSANTNWTTTSFDIDAENYAPGNYTVWVNSVNEDSNGFKVGGSNVISFTIAGDIQMGIAELVKIRKAGPVRYYAFTAPVKGTYTFESSNKEVEGSLYGAGAPYMIHWDPNTYPAGDLYDVNLNPVTAKDDDYVGPQAIHYTYTSGGSSFLGGRDFVKRYILEKGQTYFFAARSQDTFNPDIDHATDNGSFDLTVTVNTRIDSALPLDSSNDSSVYIDEPGMKNYFEFIPEETGIYTFESRDYGNSSPTLAVYNSNEEQIGDGGNSIQIYLNAGETYYIEGGFANGETGSYALSVGNAVDLWAVNTAYEEGQIIAYGTNSNGNPVLYMVLQAHTSMRHWAPGGTPSLYKLITSPLWTQPVGPHDAYSIGDMVVYNGREWVSTIDANVWRPGVHGWALA